jgi:hypothetical protein
MLRRPFTEEPMSRLAAWSGRLAWFALAVAALSVAVVRSGLLELEPALVTFGASLVFATFAILLALAAFVSIWRQGRGGLGRAIWGLVLGLALLAYPAYLGYRAWKLPAIYDVTTDTANPPRFDALGLQRGTIAAYPLAFAPLQRAAYPNIGTLQYDAPPKLVFDIALAVIAKRKWRVADARPPAPGRREATIEATARSLIMGFPDDVVIRVTPVGNGTRVDIRSASRHPWHDFGVNASRVQALLDDIDDAVNAAPEPRRQPLPPEPKGQPPKRPAEKRR